MSLVISLRIPDGIVMAADSLSTAQMTFNIIQKDEKSGKESASPPIPIPISASSFTQKLFPLLGKYGIGTYGLGIINNKSIYHHISSFNNVTDNYKCDIELISIDLIKYFENELEKQFPNYKKAAPPDWKPFGMHISGYKDNIGITKIISIGKENKISNQINIGSSFGGEGKVIKKLWEIGDNNPNLKFKFHLFSLQDAIDHCIYLIETTSKFQRFSNDFQTVGGEIDIALITPIHNFRWIQRKKLMEVLDNEQ